jgi:hypothetical protein
VEEIMDEFAFGNSDPAAIHAFLAHAYETWALPRLKYVVLLGDGHYDFHDHLGKGAVNHVPPYMVETEFAWTACDNRYASVVGDDVLPDLRIGRIPASDLTQAHALLDKLETYEGTPWDDSWASGVIFVADNPDEVFDFEASCEALIGRLPPGYTAVRDYLEAEGSGDATRTKLFAELASPGAGITLYSGHGNLFRWADEAILKTFPTNDLDALDNTGRPTVGLVLNCLSGGFFHPDPGFLTVGETWVRHDRGGAVAFWASTSLTRPAPQQAMAEALFDQLQEQGGAGVLGDLADTAKLRMAANRTDFHDVVDSWTILGDPAMSLLAETPLYAEPNDMPPPPVAEPTPLVEPRLDRDEWNLHVGPVRIGCGLGALAPPAVGSAMFLGLFLLVLLGGRGAAPAAGPGRP